MKADKSKQSRTHGQPSFQGNGVNVRKSKVPINEAKGPREHSTKNDTR